MENASAYHFAYFEPSSRREDDSSHDHRTPLTSFDDSFSIGCLFLTVHWRGFIRPGEKYNAASLTMAKVEPVDLDRSMKIQKRGVVLGLQTDRRLLLAYVRKRGVTRLEIRGRIVGRRR